MFTFKNNLYSFKSLALTAIAAASITLSMAHAAIAAPKIGEPAPIFTATTMNGESVNLEDYRGKKVVLEWTNHQCPYVIKHYDSGNMQKAQETATVNGDVVWLSIVSSAPDLQGFTTPEQAQKVAKEVGSHASERLLDPSGEIGKLYNAQTTPHMFIIDEKGTLVYQGAIDDKPSSRISTVDGANNYVLAALDALKSGAPISPATTKPYGCSVKYAY